MDNMIKLISKFAALAFHAILPYLLLTQIVRSSTMIFCPDGSHQWNQTCFRDVQNCLQYYQGVQCIVCEKDYSLNTTINQCYDDPEQSYYEKQDPENLPQFLTKWNESIISYINKQQESRIDEYQNIFVTLYKKKTYQQQAYKNGLKWLNHGSLKLSYKIIVLSGLSFYQVQFVIIYYWNLSTQFEYHHSIFYQLLKIERNLNDRLYLLDDNKLDKRIEQKLVQELPQSFYEMGVALILPFDLQFSQIQKVSARFLYADRNDKTLYETIIWIKYPKDQRDSINQTLAVHFVDSSQENTDQIVRPIFNTTIIPLTFSEPITIPLPDPLKIPQSPSQAKGRIGLGQNSTIILLLNTSNKSTDLKKQPLSQAKLLQANPPRVNISIPQNKSNKNIVSNIMYIKFERDNLTSQSQSQNYVLQKTKPWLGLLFITSVYIQVRIYKNDTHNISEVVFMEFNLSTLTNTIFLDNNQRPPRIRKIRILTFSIEKKSQNVQLLQNNLYQPICLFFQTNLTQLTNNDPQAKSRILKYFINLIKSIMKNFIQNSQSSFKTDFQLFKVKLYSYNIEVEQFRYYLQIMYIIPEKVNITYEFIQYRFQLNISDANKSKSKGSVVTKRQIFQQTKNQNRQIIIYDFLDKIKKLGIGYGQQGNITSVKNVKNKQSVYRIQVETFNGFKLVYQRENTLTYLLFNQSNLRYPQSLKSAPNKQAFPLPYFVDTFPREQVDFIQLKASVRVFQRQKQPNQLTNDQFREIIAAFFESDPTKVIFIFAPQIRRYNFNDLYDKYYYQYQWYAPENAIRHLRVEFLIARNRSKNLFTSQTNELNQSQSIKPQNQQLFYDPTIKLPLSMPQNISMPGQGNKSKKAIQMIISNSIQSSSSSSSLSSEKEAQKIKQFKLNVPDIIPLMHSDSTFQQQIQYWKDNLVDQNQTQSQYDSLLEKLFYNKKAHNKQLMKIQSQRYVKGRPNIKLITFTHLMYGTIEVWLQTLKYFQRIKAAKYSNGYHFETSNLNFLKDNPRFTEAHNIITSKIKNIFQDTLYQEQITVFIEDIIKWEYRRLKNIQELRFFYEMKGFIIQACTIIENTPNGTHIITLTKLNATLNGGNIDQKAKAIAEQYKGGGGFAFRNRSQTFIYILRRPQFRTLQAFIQLNFGVQFTILVIDRIQVEENTRQSINTYNITYIYANTIARIVLEINNKTNQIKIIQLNNTNQFQTKYRATKYYQIGCEKINQATRSCQKCKETHILHKKLKQCYLRLPYCALQSGNMCFRCLTGYVHRESIWRCS